MFPMQFKVASSLFDQVHQSNSDFPNHFVHSQCIINCRQKWHIPVIMHSHFCDWNLLNFLSWQWSKKLEFIAKEMKWIFNANSNCIELVLSFPLIKHFILTTENRHCEKSMHCILCLDWLLYDIFKCSIFLWFPYVSHIYFPI